MKRLLAAFVCAFLALPGLAQTLPEFAHTSINDFAGLLSEADTETLDKALIALHSDTGVEGTVVTLSDRARYGGNDGLEPFATRLFNHWGVGDAVRNDGFMLLILRDDHEARIELGAGYPNDADIMAQQIMRNVIVPEFRAGRLSEGIRKGTLAVIDHIARPHHQPGFSPDQPLIRPAPATPADTPANLPSSSGFDWLSNLMPFAVFGIIGLAFVQILRSLLEKWRGRVIQPAFSACPKCGHRGLVRDSFETSDPLLTGGLEGTFHVTSTRCPECGWSDRQVGPPRGRSILDSMSVGGGGWGGTRSRGSSGRSSGGSSGRSSGGFGGGRSSGGGSSGRW